jgi:hypothetical protein
MKRQGIERSLVILLFVLVLVVFSFAERDSRKLDRLYKTAQLIQKASHINMVQVPAAPARNTDN